MKNGWMTAAKKPVKNRELWVRLHELDQIMHPNWAWVKGHSGNDANERCDTLVQQEIARLE
jgi:ribonuclease HI